jgi:hypothetical protein
MPQNQQMWFGDLAHKIIVTVFWFGHQNQVGYGMSVAPKTDERMKTVQGTC